MFCLKLFFCIPLFPLSTNMTTIRLNIILYSEASYLLPAVVDMGYDDGDDDDDDDGIVIGSENEADYKNDVV